MKIVTRKITDGVARIKLGLSDNLTLGNLDSKRDWGYSPDYVKSMWLMLQQDEPDDYVIATGVEHSIRDFLDCAFDYIGVSDWSKYVLQDERYMRPAEVAVLCGDSSKAREVIGWKPETSFEQMVFNMVGNDIKLLG
jgi:GDPmannose 4,6-dehydratase